MVDRPAPSPPDWMSGVQIPEFRVTRDLDPGEAAGRDRSVVDVAQQVVGLVLVAILVAVVVLVLASSLSVF